MTENTTVFTHHFVLWWWYWMMLQRDWMRLRLTSGPGTRRWLLCKLSGNIGQSKSTAPLRFPESWRRKREKINLSYTEHQTFWKKYILWSYCCAGRVARLLCYDINPLRAKFLRENINIYLYFMSFLHTNKTQVVEIPPRVRQRPAYST